LNSASPALTSLFFFLAVALGEELGYRFFGGAWLLALSGRKWVAIVVPGLIYGLAHTRLDFLPPAEPFWARALVLTLVGCVWGWAFFRYDALTVVLSHFTADLFIFNWPRMASGRPGPVAVSVAVVCVPLLPAILGWCVRGLVGFERRRRG
jgi:membrane protease YdiL (CAAX protease family)